MNFVLFSTVFVFLATSYQVETQDQKDGHYFDKFAAWHCYKKMTCTKGGGWVCGVDRSREGVTIARFPDKCHLHGVNCRKQGVYWQISTEVCYPVKIVYEEVFDYGEPNFVYSTLPFENSTEPFPEGQLNDEYSTETLKPLRHRTKIVSGSIFTKIKDTLGISAKFSLDDATDES
ncbi:hypothetical protein PYW07_008932 [Mythimna separata]|uniref:Uncharacterized protein n=1 Tax=Mythimna separata TaxID=271217 RepID=A0AAD8DMQ8_MYTSE|nr:hypothetical protein PYW07_008932 [Mythimna separata]